jgi:hypothetical protein
VVLLENNGSDKEIVYVACHRKKRNKTAPLVVPASQSSDVQAIKKVELEVDTQVNLPQTGHFGEDFPSIQVDNESDADLEETDIGGRFVNLLDEEDL